MKVVCRSRAAREWLALLDPEPAWLEPINQEKPPGCDLLVVPGELEPDGGPAYLPPGEIALDGGSAYLPAGEIALDGGSADILPGERRSVGGPTAREERVLVWAPQTLKSTLDHALRLARLTDRLPALMALLAHREVELGKLASLIGNLKRPTGVCIFFDGTWRVMGAWGPDLIDRAGGRPLLQDSGDPHVDLVPGDLSNTRPEVLFLACDDMSVAGALLNGLGRPPPVPYLPRVYILPPDGILYSGPSLHEIIFSMASVLHPGKPGLSVYPNPLRRIDLSG